MNNTLKSLLALLLCMAMLVCAVACKPQDADEPNNDQVGKPDEPGEPDTPTPINGLAVVLDGAAQYRVARGDMESVTVRDNSMALIAAIEDVTGVRPTPVTDYEAYDENVKEIIVGKKNNRPATAAATELLKNDTFCISVVDGNVVITGDSDKTTTAAVEYFIQKYVKGESGSLILPKEISDVVTYLEWQTMNYDKTVTLKTSYSDYVSDYTEELLIPFDPEDKGYRIERGGFYDEDHSVDGYGALRWDLKGKIEKVTKILSHGNTFEFDATNKNRSTLKFWLYVSDTDAVVCDHDPGYGFQKNQATFYFRAMDYKGRTHGWNHTLTNNGWHEVELSFNIENGADKDFDYANITGFWVGLCTYDDVTIMMDDMRGVTYETDYTPEPVEGEKNARLISDCESDALDGAIIQEWYGTSYDLEDKVQGNSSLRNYGDASVNDYRTIISSLDIPMDHAKDELVFHFKVADPKVLQHIFIELNEVQDTHEFSARFTLEQLKQYGYGGEKNTWYEIRIPLSAFTVQLGKGMGDTVTLRNFRFVGSATSTGTFDYHIDHIYLCEK